MTMFTAENRQQSCGGYGGGGYGGVEGFSGMSHLQGYYISDLVVVGSPILMAEDPKEKSSSKNDEIVRDEEEEEEQEEHEHEQGWLQLSIGGGHSYQVKKDEKNNENENGNRNENENESSRVELELMPSSSSRNYSNESQFMRPFAPEFRAPMPVMNFANPSSFLLQQQHGIISGASNYTHQHQEIMNWGFRPPFIPIINSNIAAASSQSYPSSSPAAPSLTYYPQQQFQLYAATAGGVDMAAGAAAVDFRVIQPPKRPHSGIWFMLQASQNQEKEPFLPQISKSYLRIKDGSMTIRLVIKYLVNKLRLDNESEIEIRCRGQRVAPFLTLQHVRDSIWSNPNNRSDDFLTLLPNSSTTPHLMVLHYARSTS